MTPASGMKTCTTRPWLMPSVTEIIYNAYTIQIEGESMRKRKSIPE